MVLSRWPNPPGRERAVLSRCLISSPVRYSRGRAAALVVRLGVIVRFSRIGALPRFVAKPLFLIRAVYPVVRISAKKGTIHDPNRHVQKLTSRLRSHPFRSNGRFRL